MTDKPRIPEPDLLDRLHRVSNAAGGELRDLLLETIDALTIPVVHLVIVEHLPDGDGNLEGIPEVVGAYRTRNRAMEVIEMINYASADHPDWGDTVARRMEMPCDQLPVLEKGDDES